MPELSIDFIVEAPAEAVWDVVGRRFDHIGEWATAIPASAAIPAPSSQGVPVAGRVCRTGVHLLPEVTETIVAYDDIGRTLTYEASGMPAFVTVARNTWTVTALDRRRTRLSLRAQFDTRGALGRLVRWALLAQVRRTSRHLADDLRHFVEQGTPSLRKQAQLHRLRR
jgi:polyketide cyclase/dehydrase/lipid transport protein